MSTDDLIRSLAADTRATGRRTASRLFGLALAIGVTLSVVSLWFWLGFRSDLLSAALGPTLWIKLGFVGSVGAAALVVVRRLGRPEATAGRLWWVVVIPFAGMAALAAAELAQTAPDLRVRTWLGFTAAICPPRIVALGAPILVALLWLLRTRLAPTRPMLAGLATGLAAGGLGAAVYALYCSESSAAFMATWYGLGIVLNGALGAAIGSRALRW